jgi:hypothetical protein
MANLLHPALGTMAALEHPDDRQDVVTLRLKQYLCAPTAELAAETALNGLLEGATHCLVEVRDVPKLRRFKKGGEQQTFHAAELK